MLMGRGGIFPICWIPFCKGALLSSCRYFLYGKPTDVRFGITSQAGLMQNRLGLDPMNGHIFLFIGKRSNLIRTLH
jgi:transposase